MHVEGVVVGGKDSSGRFSFYFEIKWNAIYLRSTLNGASECFRLRPFKWDLKNAAYLLSQFLFS